MRTFVDAMCVALLNSPGYTGSQQHKHSAAAAAPEEWHTGMHLCDAPGGAVVRGSSTQL